MIHPTASVQVPSHEHDYTTFNHYTYPTPSNSPPPKFTHLD